MGAMEYGLRRVHRPCRSGYIMWEWRLDRSGRRADVSTGLETRTCHLIGNGELKGVTIGNRNTTPTPMWVAGEGI